MESTAEEIEEEPIQDGFCFHCSPEFHFSQYPLAGLVYAQAFRISKRTGRFHASLPNLAEYFRVSERTMIRVVKWLVREGFFEVVSKECFHPSVYHVLGHTEWAQKHGGRCATKQTLPWSGEKGDQLGVELWNASGRKLNYRAFQLKALRNTELSDEQILQAFRRFIENEDRRRREQGWRGRWQYVHWRFLKWLKGELTEAQLERLGLERFCLDIDREEADVSPIAV
jgi:hypothetical protein